MKGLYVEDDLELAKVVIENLEEKGVFVKWTRSVKDAVDALNKESFSFYLVDLGLIDGEGYEVADHLKSQNLKGPLIFLTARSEAKDRLKGYEHGACEYIPKPFLFAELWLRLDHALSEHGETHIFKLDEAWQFDSKAQRVSSSEGESIDLTIKEALFLKNILDRSPQPMRRSEVLDEVWGEGKYPTERTVDNLVVRLRQKLGALGKRVESIRAVGYRWSD